MDRFIAQWKSQSSKSRDGISNSSDSGTCATVDLTELDDDILQDDIITVTPARKRIRRIPDDEISSSSSSSCSSNISTSRHISVQAPWIFGRQSTGKTRRLVRKRLIRQLYGSMQEYPHRYFVNDHHNGAIEVLCPRHAHYISCIEFDKYGSLFAAASTDGWLMVHEFDRCLAQWVASKAHPNDMFCKDRTPTPIKPLRSIWLGARIESVAWNPQKENELAVCCPNRSKVCIFDLERSVKRPTFSRDVKGSSGVLDITFLDKRGMQLVACNRNGGVCLWDLRGRSHHAVSLAYEESNRPVQSLAVSPDNQILYIAQDDGSIVSWDIRNIRTPQSCMNIRNLLPNSTQSQLPLSFLDCAILDPLDPACLIFQCCEGSVGRVNIAHASLSKLVTPLATSPNFNELTSNIRRRRLSLACHSEIAVVGSNSNLLTFVDMALDVDIEMAVQRRHTDRKLVGLDTVPDDIVRPSTVWELTPDEIRSSSIVGTISIREPVSSTAMHPYLNNGICGTSENTLHVFGNEGLGVEEKDPSDGDMDIDVSG
eukprot:138682_1